MGLAMWRLGGSVGRSLRRGRSGWCRVGGILTIVSSEVGVFGGCGCGWYLEAMMDERYGVCTTGESYCAMKLGVSLVRRVQSVEETLLLSL
jgi:hypothetical protein